MSSTLGWILLDAGFSLLGLMVVVLGLFLFAETEEKPGDFMDPVG